MTEARKKENRCGHCFQCPQCSSTLTTRSVIVPSEVLGDHSPQKREPQPTTAGASSTPTTPPRTSALSGASKSPGGTKLYYLSCTHCRWNSRDAGIKDKRSPVDFKDRPSPHQKRIEELVSFYKELALKDRAEREKSSKKQVRRLRSFGNLLDPSKFITASGIDSPGSVRRGSALTVSDIKKVAAETTDDPHPPPDKLYTTPLCLEEVTTLKQRFLDPAFQPTQLDDLWPRPLSLIGRKLHRCKGCEHILLKAEINPASIRFKIQNIAQHVFPQVQIVELPKLQVGKSSTVIISFTNPVNYLMNFSIAECSPSAIDQTKEVVFPVKLPIGSFVLTPNDDLGDLLEDEDGFRCEDDPELVHERLPGKLVLKFSVAPEDPLNPVKFLFNLTFDHKSTLEPNKPEMYSVSAFVLVNLGRPEP